MCNMCFSNKKNFYYYHIYSRVRRLHYCGQECPLLGVSYLWRSHIFGFRVIKIRETGDFCEEDYAGCFCY